MDEAGQRWVARLREQVRLSAETAPVPDIGTLSGVEEKQFQIIRDSLRGWLERRPRCMKERRKMARLVGGLDEEPIVVFTSDKLGLAAARELLGDSGDGIVVMRTEHFEQWLDRHPDPDNRWHVQHWSHVRTACPADFLERAKRSYPLGRGSTYWQHVEGIFWGPSAGFENHHLWKWDGNDCRLLHQGFLVRHF